MPINIWLYKILFNIYDLFSSQPTNSLMNIMLNAKSIPYIIPKNIVIYSHSTQTAINATVISIKLISYNLDLVTSKNNTIYEPANP